MIPSFRILIVDDEPFNVDYLEQELKTLAMPRQAQERSGSLGRSYGAGT